MISPVSARSYISEMGRIILLRQRIEEFSKSKVIFAGYLSVKQTVSAVERITAATGDGFAEDGKNRKNMKKGTKIILKMVSLFEDSC